MSILFIMFVIWSLIGTILWQIIILRPGENSCPKDKCGAAKMIFV